MYKNKKKHEIHFQNHTTVTYHKTSTGSIKILIFFCLFLWQAEATYVNIQYKKWKEGIVFSMAGQLYYGSNNSKCYSTDMLAA